jgi:hypothetical protein
MVSVIAAPGLRGKPDSKGLLGLDITRTSLVLDSSAKMVHTLHGRLLDERGVGSVPTSTTLVTKSWLGKVWVKIIDGILCHAPGGIRLITASIVALNVE